MAKTILKEIIIILLLLVAIVLALGILFYDYIPTNKTIPSVEKYSTAENIKTELAESITEDETVLVTYEITSADLKTYEKKGNYDKGKANPFSTYVIKPAGGNTEGNGDGSGTGTSSNSNTIKNPDTNTNTNSSNGNTYYKNTGIK